MVLGVSTDESDPTSMQADYTRVQACPNCGAQVSMPPYDIGSGPEMSCPNCEWCWGADGQDLKALPTPAMSENAIELTVIPPTVTKLGDPRVQNSGWTLLPTDTSEGQCSQCAVDHEPEFPHDARSMAYQYSYYAEHGRWPNWRNAMEHCSPEMQEQWVMLLAQKGVDADGVQV